MNLKFFISTDQIISNNDFTSQSFEVSIYPPEFGESTPYNSAPSIKLNGSTVGNNLVYGNYYLIAILDKEKVLENSEIATFNNIYIIPIRYQSSANGRPALEGKYPKTIINLNDMSEINISDEFDEKIEINNLNSGFYVIKNSEGKTKKIVKY